MKRKAPKGRNPVARALRLMRQRKVASAKSYHRHAKHRKARPEAPQDGLFLFAFRTGAIQPPAAACGGCP